METTVSTEAPQAGRAFPIAFCASAGPKFSDATDTEIAQTIAEVEGWGASPLARIQKMRAARLANAYGELDYRYGARHGSH
jgi:hypothetical protein